MYLHTIKKTINISVSLLFHVRGQNVSINWRISHLKFYSGLAKVFSVNMNMKAWNGDQEVWLEN